MAGWLSRATDAFRKPAAAPPEPFAVRCDCGGTVAGERVSAAQKPACPRCGTSVFVLPLNVYPAPPRPAPPNAVGTAKPDATKPAKPDTSATVTAPREAAASSRKTQSSPKAKPGLREPVAAQVQPAAAAPNGILVDAPSRMLTPFRLIVVVIGAIGMVTAWGLWHRQRVEFAKASVQAAAEAGLAALKDGNFAAAARDLSRARDAVDLLRRTDPESHTIRRHCREAVAGYELSGSSLFELLAGYAAEVRQGKAASRRSMSRSRDSWLLLDTLVSNPDATDGTCQLDIPLLFDGLKFRVEVDSSLVRIAARRAQADGNARVIFAAQMSEIRPASIDDPHAVLVLNGTSAFLWTNLDTYVALGYVEEVPEELDATRNLLTRQLEQTEASP